MTQREKKYTNLRKLRSRFAWAKYEHWFTARELAEYLDLDETYISKILRGHRTPAETICRALEMVKKFKG